VLLLIIKFVPNIYYICGLIDKNGKVVNYVLPNVTAEIVTPLMVEAVDDKATLVTDAHFAYRFLKLHYAHEVVNHAKDEYVRDGYHTNGIENYWSVLKRGIYGIYHQVNPKHLHRYCNEFSGRYNTREVSNTERFDITVGNSSGWRLKYDKLTGKK
jgi:hypothetical protein